MLAFHDFGGFGDVLVILHANGFHGPAYQPMVSNMHASGFCSIALLLDFVLAVTVALDCLHICVERLSGVVSALHATLLVLLPCRRCLAAPPRNRMRRCSAPAK